MSHKPKTDKPLLNRQFLMNGDANGALTGRSLTLLLYLFVPESRAVLCSWRASDNQRPFCHTKSMRKGLATFSMQLAFRGSTPVDIPVSSLLYQVRGKISKTDARRSLRIQHVNNLLSDLFKAARIPSLPQKPHWDDISHRETPALD